MHYADLVPHSADFPRRGGGLPSPDVSPAPYEQDMESARQRNRLATVLKEAAGAVIYSTGLVVLLIAILQLLHAR